MRTYNKTLVSSGNNNMQTKSCPALLVSAPSSHSGKTTVTAALARYWTQQGKTVRVFKTGPDFLDPMPLEQASSVPVHQLDLWMMGEDNCRRRLAEAAQDADLILIEGVMGLYDGHTSSAISPACLLFHCCWHVDGSGDGADLWRAGVRTG